MAKKETEVVVSNASPLIFLMQIKKLELLRKLFGKVLITTIVYEEIKNKEQKLILQEEIKKGWIRKLKAPKLDVIHDLDMGEASSIALALQYKKSLFIVDDMQARRFSESIGLEIIGTIGVLILAKRKKLLSNVLSLLEEANAFGFWISKKVYEDIKSL